MRRVLHCLLALGLLQACAGPVRHFGAGSGSHVESNGDLRVMLLLTNDLEEVKERWAQPASPTLDTISTAKTGERIFAVLVFTGCAADASGLCQLVVDYAITNPHGQTSWSDHGRPVCLGRPPPPAGLLSLGQESPDFSVTSGPLGIYRIRAAVHDQVNGNVVELEVPIDIR